MSNFARGFSDELQKLSFLEEGFPIMQKILPTVGSLTAMLPGAVLGGGLGGAISAIGDSDNTMRDVGIGALLGGALSSGLLGSEFLSLLRSEARRGEKLPHSLTSVPAAAVGAVTGGGLGALSTKDKKKRKSRALRGALAGAAGGGLMGGMSR